MPRSNQPTDPPAADDRSQSARLEAEWVARAQRGDLGAFRDLVDRHRDHVYGLALRIVRSPADAEEVAQDAFVRAWRALPRFRGDAAFGTWLYRIALRLSVDRAARLGRRRAREQSLELGPVPEPAAPGSDRAAEPRIERLMERLTVVQRAVVTLYYYRDHSVEDVARLLAMPENTVKTHLSRARAALRAGWLESESG